MEYKNNNKLASNSCWKRVKNTFFQHCHFQVMATNNLTQHSRNGNNYLHYNLEDSRRPEMFRGLQFLCNGIQNAGLSLERIALFRFLVRGNQEDKSKDSGDSEPPAEVMILKRNCFLGVQEEGAISCTIQIVFQSGVICCLVVLGILLVLVVVLFFPLEQSGFAGF